MSDFFEKLFELKKNNTDIRTELIAGFTTFLTMSYVIIVSPSILSTGAGIPFSGALTATILVSAFSSILMGLVANLPLHLHRAWGSLQIKDNRIVHIQIVEHWALKGKKAELTVVRNIIEQQSTGVDAVSGATNSSRVIMNAVQRAIEKAYND